MPGSRASVAQSAERRSRKAEVPGSFPGGGSTGVAFLAMTDVYLRLGYKDYKRLEDQLRHWEDLETTHTSVDGYYHKALRLDIGDLCLEVQGPAVKQPIREDGPG